MPASGKEISLYFHIPFCRKKCPYCHFYVLPDKPEFKQLLLEAFKLEWAKRLQDLRGKRIVSIYFGGGTPSLFESGPLAALLEWIRTSGIEIAEDCEITLETNPEDVSHNQISSFAEMGINRISMGVQSLDDSSLQILGRGHLASVALSAIDTIQRAAIQNLSIDLMYDLPQQSLTSWKKTLEKLKELPLTHLSLYNLTFEPETVYFKRKKTLIPQLPTPDESLKMLELAVSELEALGFKRYEISAFAKEGYSSRHNTGYWTARPFLGFGPSAFSYWNGARFRNVANLKEYHAALKRGDLAVDFEERLSPPDHLNELLAVELRLLAGVDLSQFEARHGALPAVTRTSIDSLVQQSWLALQGARLKLTDQGLLFYDSVATALI